MRRVDPAPIEFGCKEGSLGGRIGDLRHPLRIRELRKARKLLAPPFTHGVGQLPAVVGKKEEWRRRAPFLAHEQHRYLRREQVDACQRPDSLRTSERIQALAKCAIADLVVVLDERYESIRRQSGAGTAAGRISIPHHLALI